ncbi:MAG: type III pantothenate kinase [Bacteroidales bacterium]|nr:type III pantothenate kinase [Bacteroidales bacterium]
MNLAIDIGNTAVKWAAFDGKSMVESGIWTAESGRWNVESGKWKATDNAIACVSGESSVLESISEALGIRIPTFGPDSPLPIKLDYKTPATLGPDRIAAACGAWSLHPAEASLIIDAGTCITVDYIDAEGTYHGGAIMPGLGMSLRALHDYTAKLPLVDPGTTAAPRIPGRSTTESIIAGTLGSTMLALAGFVTLYRQRSPELHVILTGGDARRLTAAGVGGWETVPMLTLAGLNEIMLYNEK